MERERPDIKIDLKPGENADIYHGGDLVFHTNSIREFACFCMGALLVKTGETRDRDWYPGPY